MSSPMALILVVRDDDHMPASIANCNDLLAIHRGQSHGHRREDRVLGVWLRENVDVGLPRMDCHDLAPLEDAPFRNGNSSHQTRNKVPTVRIRESISLSGVWTLCWIHGSPIHRVTNTLQGLCDLAENLIGPYSTTKRGFFPAFPAGASVHAIERVMLKSRSRYPDLIGTTWFRDDWSQGLIKGID